MNKDGFKMLINKEGNFNNAKYIQLLKDHLIPDFDEDKIF